MAFVGKASDGLSLEQIMSNCNGFTLDTSDFDGLIDPDDYNYNDVTELTDEEMVRQLHLEDDDEDMVGGVPLATMTFEELKEKMSTVDDHGEVLKLILIEGEGNIVPEDCQVTVRYAGYFEAQDDPFDSTYLHPGRQYVFHLGKGEMIPGLEIAMRSMKKSEKSIFIIQPKLAYGKLGSPPRVPPNAEVLFKIDLIDYLNKEDVINYDELTDEEKKKFFIVEKIATNFLNLGLFSFKKHKYKQAIREYNHAINYLGNVHLENDEEKTDFNKILSRTLTNLIICYNKVDKPKLACSSFERLPTKNVKAYFHYSRALTTLGEHDEALKYLQKALSLVPSCPDVKKLIENVSARRKKDLEFFKRFSRNSLQIIKETKDDTFENTAADVCDSLIQSSLLRQEIPSNLSSEEMQCIEKIAASRDLSITEQTFREANSRTYFLTKKLYHSTE